MRITFDQVLYLTLSALSALIGIAIILSNHIS